MFFVVVLSSFDIDSMRYAFPFDGYIVEQILENEQNNFFSFFLQSLSLTTKSMQSASLSI